MTAVIDLSLLKPDDEVLCPNCGIVFSPDDHSTNNYKILETKTDKEKKNIEELVLKCQKCDQLIRLVGFNHE